MLSRFLFAGRVIIHVSPGRNGAGIGLIRIRELVRILYILKIIILNQHGSVTAYADTIIIALTAVIIVVNMTHAIHDAGHPLFAEVREPVMVEGDFQASVVRVIVIACTGSHQAGKAVVILRVIVPDLTPGHRNVIGSQLNINISVRSVMGVQMIEPDMMTALYVDTVIRRILFSITAFDGEVADNNVAFIADIEAAL